MTKPLFSWDGQYCLEETLAFARFKHKKHRKPTESKVLRKIYTRTLRRKLKKIEREDYDD